MDIAKMLNECEVSVIELKEMVDNLGKKLKGRVVSRSLEHGFSSFNSNLVRYSSVISDENSNAQLIIDTAKNLAVSGQLIGQSIKKEINLDTVIKELGRKILQRSTLFRNWTDNRPELAKIFNTEIVNIARLGDYILPRTSSEIEKDEENMLSQVEKDLKKMKEDNEEYQKNIRDIFNKNQKYILDVENKLDHLNSKGSNELEKIKGLYEKTLDVLKDKEKEIDDILGIVSENTIVGNFEKSSEEEKNMANKLRGIAVAGMLLITGIVAYSFIDSTHSFNWEESIFRIMLVVFLSVPTTYLARESTKHRKQQYKHLQMSLELKATTPYWKSLPEDEQHKLKIELSRKMFANENPVQVEVDPFPINMQELTSKLIDKIPKNT